MMQFSRTQGESKKFSDVETPWDGPSSKRGTNTSASKTNMKTWSHTKQLKSFWQRMEYASSSRHLSRPLGCHSKVIFKPHTQGACQSPPGLLHFLKIIPTFTFFCDWNPGWGEGYIYISYPSDIENYTPWKLTNDIGASPFANRKYIDSFMVDFPASHVSFRVGYLDVPGS